MGAASVLLFGVCVDVDACASVGARRECVRESARKREMEKNGSRHEWPLFLN